jgi:hypothetical protein
VVRERNTEADNGRGLCVPLFAAAAALLFGATCYAFDCRFGPV